MRYTKLAYGIDLRSHDGPARVERIIAKKQKLADDAIDRAKRASLRTDGHAKRDHELQIREYYIQRGGMLRLQEELDAFKA